MSNTIVKEKTPRTPKTPKFRCLPPTDEDLVDILPLEKKVKKVSLKKTEPVVEKEPVVVSEEVFIPPPVLPVVVEKEADPIVVDKVFTLVEEETPESKLELFKKLSKEIYKGKREAKLKALTPEELEAKKQQARQKNKEYREKNKDKIREKDKKYATEKAEVIKEKRVAKLQDPEAKKAYNEQQRLYKEKARAQAKAVSGAEPKPAKAMRMTKAQQRDLILSHAELTAEQKLEELAKLIK
tara:strand:- start:235 stop:954 length:720 start_codon:yes stop_codon:yes gene_type:complete